MLSSVAGRRQSKLSLESPIKSSLGFVADIRCNLRDPARRCRQSPCRTMQSPSNQISDRRLLKIPRKAFHKSRARKPDFLCKFGDSPGMLRFGMQERQTFSHNGITRRCEPANFLFRQTCHITSQRVYKERFGKFCQHCFASRLSRGGFLDQMKNRVLQPMSGTVCAKIDLESWRKALKNRPAKQRITYHVTAHETADVATSSGMHRIQVSSLDFRYDRRRLVVSRTFFAIDPVGISVRQNDHIACLKTQQ